MKCKNPHCANELKTYSRQKGRVFTGYCGNCAPTMARGGAYLRGGVSPKTDDVREATRWMPE